MSPATDSTTAPDGERGQGACQNNGAMRIEVRLTRGVIHPMHQLAGLKPEAVDGAWAEFTGFVRGTEHGQDIEALEVEAYESMATKVMREILARLSQQHPCSAAGVIHRLGVIPVGEAAIWVGVASRHRREAFALLAGFMDELKRDVPIWKHRAVPTVPKP